MKESVAEKLINEGKKKGGGDIDWEWGREKGLLGKETHVVFACREFLVADPYGK